MKRIGLALSGGGSKGAFSVGVLKAIRQKLDVPMFPVIAGTSTGALIGTLLATGEWTKLVHIYSTVTTESIVNPNHAFIGTVFGPEAVLFAAAIFGGRSVYDTAALRATIAHNIDFSKVKAAAAKTHLIYATVDLQTGGTVYFDNRTHSAAVLAEALLASSNQPVLMDPVDLPAGAQTHQFVDGGVREFLPLQAVLESDEELDHIFAIMTSPLDPPRGKPEYDKIVDILGRTVTLFNAEVADNDERGARLYSAILRMIDNAKAAGLSRTKILEGVDARTRAGIKDKRAVPVTLVAPEIDFEAAWGMNGLAFDPPTMQLAMSHGVTVGKKAIQAAGI